MRPRVVKELLRDHSGLTLLEAVISVGILAVVAGLFSAAVFHVLSVQRDWRPEMEATKNLRQAGSLFSIDAINAVTTTLVDLAAPVSSTTMYWKDSANNSHTSTYALDGTGSFLLRTFDGAEREIAPNVVSIQFSISGALLTFYLEVEASKGGTKSRTLHTYLRHLKASHLPH